MSMESDLSALLKTLCPRAFADVAPLGTAAPYVVWQGLGGESRRFTDNAPDEERHTLMQVSVWGTSRVEALTLIRAIEDAICASSAFFATPQGEAMSTYEPDTQLFGSIQRFEILATR